MIVRINFHYKLSCKSAFTFHLEVQAWSNDTYTQLTLVLSPCYPFCVIDLEPVREEGHIIPLTDNGVHSLVLLTNYIVVML